jgi:hypothetical protein
MILKKLKLPDFLVVGAAKSGTSSLYSYLKRHKSVFLPPKKECYFFSFKDSHPVFQSPNRIGGIISDFGDYQAQFANAKKSQRIGDNSTLYLYTHKKTIMNIKDIYEEDHKKLKIIIILRNPVERAFSQYSMFARDGEETLCFGKAIQPEMITSRIRNNWNIYYDYLSFGNYCAQIKPFMDTFPQTKIYLFEDLTNNKRKLISDISRFLEISDLPIRDNTKYNASGRPRSESLHYILSKDNLAKSYIKKIGSLFFSPEFMKMVNARLFNFNLKKVSMSDNTRSVLNAYYAEEIHRLQDLINRDLSGWLN